MKQKGDMKKDYRVIVLLVVGILISLQTVFPTFPAEDAQTLESIVPTHLLQRPLPDQMRPLFFLPVSINRANAELLQTIPGIGPTLARRIITLRDARKGFHDMRELLDVPGIGPAKFAGIKHSCSL
ncbi:MAG: hypothetical protein BM485_09820 [Desulfobulbaceae bacterium DB1]|nr:MAG: hypothetical protein BM485_09820 [Desulfobulbaceae bacterium DB1]